ncbi:MAG: peptide chain release factor N(5)-glutamine methyltransferase [Prevotella sp.]|jgi:release factor glutamine methyltransferase
MMIENHQDLYSRLWRSLLPIYDEGEAKAVVRLLLDEGFGLTLTDIVCGKADQLPASDKKRLTEMAGRLQSGEPVQYVLGRADFCGRSFHVEPGVLIPRPETEELCRMIVSEYNKPYCALQPPVPLQVLDVGTGSGCIAVTLALDLYNAEVTAWDVSSDALLIARGNAKAIGAKVNLVYQDVLNAPDDETKWDIIVSNPPYIAEQEQKDMSPQVLDHEPRQALFVPDDDPLRFYRAIATYAARALKNDGKLFFEINPLYAEELQQMLMQEGFKEIKLVEDAFGKVRFCHCRIRA